MKPPILRSVSASERGVHVSWFELFYDLVVVASVSHGSHVFDEHRSWGMGTWLAASLLLLMTFWLLTMVSHNLYPDDDVLRRLLVLVQMVALVVSSLSLERGDEGLPDSVGFGALAIAFLTIAILFWHCGRRFPNGSGVSRVIAPWALLAAVIMLSGVFVPSNEGLFTNPITWIFIAGMLCGIVPLLFGVLNHRTSAGEINAEHLSERMGQLVLIVIGESFVSLIFGLSSEPRIPNPWYFLLDFVVAFAIWTMYFTDVLPAGVPLTAGRLRAWLGWHVILIFGTIATAGGLAALTLIPFSGETSAQSFWTPLPLLYVMIGILGLSLMVGRPLALRRIHAVVTALLAVLTALALWMIPDQARWLTLVGALLVIGDAAVGTVLSRNSSPAQ